MGDTWITDITHFEDLPPDLSKGPAGRIARYFGSIVSAASVSPVGRWVNVALWCRRRPGRKLCPGHIRLRRLEPSGPVEWHCSSCGDRGLISNWQGSSWDLSREGETEGERREMLVSREEHRELRRMVALDPESQRVVDGTVVTTRGIVMRGTEEELDDLLGCVAFEANHEENRRRRRILDGVYERVEAILDRRRQGGEESTPGRKGSGPTLPPTVEAFLRRLEGHPGQG
ncbi:MAG: hypothetical protein Q8P22_04235 [Chloroflexota bacterium]|nr:hypothetical protein [Chloroflexota bacterium]